MAYSPKEQKAIALHMSQHSCVVQLSVRPQLRFITKGSSKEHTVSLHSLVAEYERWKKDEATEKARVNREKKRQDKLKGGYREQYQ